MMRVSASPRMAPSELRSLLYRPEMLRRWIGPDVVLPPREAALAKLPGPEGSLSEGLVTSVTDTDGVHCVSVDTACGARLRISIRPGPSSDTSVVRVTVGRIQEVMDVRMTLAFWQAALNRLEAIILAIRRRRASPKQALIVIHGIGEQQPGETLRDFVRAVFGDDVAVTPRWVKPDTLSGSFEMRKVTIPAAPAPAGTPGEGRPTTDVYELYWAHLIRDSTPAQVLAWMNNLLLRRDVPASLTPHVWAVRILVLAGILVVVGGTAVAAFNPESRGTLVAGGGMVAALIAVAGLVWKVLKHRGTQLLTGHVGDAARYFEPKPDNIARRQEIREAGVRLLERMHETGDYQRIVIAAHSLGSAIAYDILTFAWNRLRQRNAGPDKPSFGALSAVETALSRAGTEPLATLPARGLQYAAWQEHRENTQPWLVTDLVTMGSPLTHGNVLMADRPEDFESMKRDRILPTCPPQVERRKPGKCRIGYALPDRSTDGSRRDAFLVPDHGALFAFTRWTNLYFPFHGIIGGDPVGGPLKERFGHWIWDRPVATRHAGFMGFAHTRYWTLASGEGDYVGPPGEDHVQCLRDALDLNSAGRMAHIAAARPAYTYL